MKKLLIGFDADTKKCGFVVYDLETSQYIYALNTDYNTIAIKTLQSIYKTYKGYKIEVYIEIPTFRTAYALAPKSNNYDLAQTMFNSGRCSEIALQFKDACQKFGFIVESVKSENRVRLDRIEYKDLNKDEIIKLSKKLKQQRKFLSKIDYNRALQMFDFSVLNTEVTDAAFLILPFI
jgi:hypothetical protein